MSPQDGRPAAMQAARAAGDSLSHARRLLCDPTVGNLALCCGEMTVAHKAIDALRRDFAEDYPGDRALKAVTGQLRAEIEAIRVLLASAARYHSGLLDRMSAAAAEPAGVFPVAAPGARIEVKA